MGNQLLLAALAILPAHVFAHLGLYHPSMYGFNVTSQSNTGFNGDNRPMVPLQDRTFDDWWFHKHMGFPPHPEDVFEWPAGGSAVAEIACNKGYTSYWRSSEGSTDISVPDGLACGDGADGGGTWATHASGINDVQGCGMGIADKANPEDVKPEDFVIFSTNRGCPWYTKNTFEVPAEMPACSQGVCHCAYFWIHAPDGGSMQMYMNAFRCKVTNTTPAARKIQPGKLARRCGAEPAIGKPANPSNCTNGAKQPLYWYQKDGNNMFEGTYSPPYYNELYGYTNGAQKDIFTNEPGLYIGSNGQIVNPSGAGNVVVGNPKTTTPAAQTSTTTTSLTHSTGSPAKAQACKRKTTGAKHRRAYHKKREGVEAGLFS